MRYCAGYQVHYCPRYGLEESESRIEENLLVQSTLWNAMQFLLVGQGEWSVELRFISRIEDRSIAVLLLLAGKDGAAAATGVLERLLPEEYGWTRLDLRRDAVPEPVRPAGAHWRVARLVRRIEFFSLPACFPWLRGQLRTETAEVAKPASAPAEVPPQGASYAGLGLPGSAGAGVSPPARSVVAQSAARGQSSGMVAFRSLRRIPMLGLPVREQYVSQPLCLPLLGDMVDHSPDRRRLCQEMQYAAPIVLSIALHPVDEAALSQDRATATYLRGWLEPFSQEVAGAGFSRIEQLRTVYDRYWLPSSYVGNLTVRVAALDDSKALGVGHCLCARMGGMRAFEVRAPSKDLSSLEPLAAPSEAEEGRLAEWLDSLGVMNDPSYAGFLARMPHLYTLDEAERLLRLPFATEAGLPGIATQLPPPFHSPSLRFQPCWSAPPAGRVRIGLAQASAIVSGPGRAEADGDAAQWHTLDASDLCKHALIVGSTGSGKTVATLFLARELARLGVPFLVIEPVKTEYFDRLRGEIPDLRRCRFEGTEDGRPAADFLCFDPLRLQPGVTVSRHVSYLKFCFEAAFPLTDVLSLVLENGLRAYYTRPPSEGGCGLGTFLRGGRKRHGTVGEAVFPSFETFSRFFLDHYLEEALAPPRTSGGGSAAAELLFNWRQLFRRRFENLQQGPLGEAFRRADALARRDLARFYNPFHALLQRPTVLELDAVADNEQKALVMAFLLTFLYERRQSEDLFRREGRLPAPASPLAHVVIVEEAHRLLSRSSAAGASRGENVGQDSRAKAVSLFVDMLAEIRAFGQGICIVEQIPTKIVAEAVKNTNLKIMLRLTSKDDRDFLGEAMNFNEEQKRFVTNLKPGQFVAFEQNVDQPLLLTLPDPSQWPDLFPRPEGSRPATSSEPG